MCVLCVRAARACEGVSRTSRRSCAACVDALAFANAYVYLCAQVLAQAWVRSSLRDATLTTIAGPLLEAMGEGLAAAGALPESARVEAEGIAEWIVRVLGALGCARMAMYIRVCGNMLIRVSARRVDECIHRRRCGLTCVRAHSNMHNAAYDHAYRHACAPQVSV